MQELEAKGSTLPGYLQLSRIQRISARSIEFPQERNPDEAPSLHASLVRILVIYQHSWWHRASTGRYSNATSVLRLSG